MDSVVEKLGFFDFFNLIIVGMFTLVGCFGITYQFSWDISNKIFSYLVGTAEVNTLFLVICVFSLITVSYIIGLLCHEVFSLIDRKIKTFDKLITNLFTNKSCIKNQKKKDRYANLAKKVFDDNGIEYSLTKDNSPGLDWNWELSNYFFTYCVYQVQIRGVNRKLEKLRDIEGLAKSFCVSGILLLAVLFGAGIVSWDTLSLPGYVYWIEAILLAAISLIFNEYRKKALKNRIRMTIDLYGAIYNSESKKPKSKGKTEE